MEGAVTSFLLLDYFNCSQQIIINVIHALSKLQTMGNEAALLNMPELKINQNLRFSKC